MTKSHPRGLYVFFFFAFILSLALVGCQLFGPGSDATDLASVIADMPPTTGPANIAMKVVIPGDKNASAGIKPTIRAAGQAFVVLRLIIVNAGNEQNPTSVLTKTVPVDESGMAQAFFSGVPGQTTICQLKIEGGSLGGKTDFHGAADLKSGNNEVTVTPVGCGDPNDVLAQVVVSVVSNPELVKAAPPDLAARVLAATEFVISGGTSGAEAYQEAFDRTLKTQTFTGLELSTISVTFDGGVKQDASGGWNLSPSQIWNGIAGAEGLRAMRVLRQGLGVAKPPMVTFSDVSRQKFALATLNPQTGAVLTYVLSDGNSLRNLSAAFIIPEDQSVIFGGTSNGLPVLLHWTATRTASIGFPPASAEIKRHFSFPGLASSTAFAQPGVEYLDADPVQRGVINVVVRDPSTLMLKEYRILADGTIAPRQPLPTAETPAPSWPLIAMGASGSVKLSWDLVPNAESYNLYYSFDAEVPAGSTRVEGAKSPQTVSGLQNGLTYYFKMTWVIGGQEYGPSRIVAAVPNEPAVTAPLTPANVHGVWLCQEYDAQGNVVSGKEPVEIVIRQTAGSPVFAIDPETWVDEGRTWLQTINDGRVTGNRLNWADLRVASGSMGYRTLWSATVNGDSMAGEGSDIMGSSFGGYLTPGDEKGIAFNDRWWFVATRTSTIVPEPVVATVTLDVSSLRGAFVCVMAAEPASHLAFIADGRGGLEVLATDFATGSYTVDNQGNLNLAWQNGSGATVNYSGKLTGTNLGALTPSVGNPIALMPVPNLGAAQGIWAGRLVHGSSSTYVTFMVGADGSILSLNGSSVGNLQTGRFILTGNGKGRVSFKTDAATSTPWSAVTVDGSLLSNGFTGVLRSALSPEQNFPCTLVRLPVGARVPAMSDLVGTWELARSIQLDGQMAEYLPTASGKRVAYTIAADGNATLQEYETQPASSGIQFLDTPVQPLKNVTWVMNGSTIVETHSDGLICHYQPTLLPDGSLRFLKSYASENHEDVGVVYIWTRKTTNLSLLEGAWMLTNNSGGNFYIISDGAGTITDFGAITCGGGKYQIDENGSFTAPIDPDSDDSFVLVGRVTGNFGTWSISGESTGGTMEKIGNRSLAQGVWSGSLVVQYNRYDTSVVATASNDITFAVDSMGRVSSVNGSSIQGLRGGHMFILPSGQAKVLVRTLNNRADPWWEFSLEGQMNGDTIYGRALVDGASEDGIAPSMGAFTRFTPNAPAFQDLIGGWNLVATVDVAGVRRDEAAGPGGELNSIMLTSNFLMSGRSYGSTTTASMTLRTATLVEEIASASWNLMGSVMRWRLADGRVATFEVTFDTAGQLQLVPTYSLGYGTLPKAMIYRKSVNIEVVPVTGISLNKATTSLDVGARETLVATVLPANATNKGVAWMTSNPAVAVVDPTGTVNAVAPGMANISAITLDGNKTAVCVVTVTTATLPPASSPIILDKVVSGATTTSMQIKITNVPEDFVTSVVVKDASGGDQLFQVEPTISSLVPGIVLTRQGTTVLTIADFNTLNFASPIPDGARVAVTQSGSELAFAIVAIGEPVLVTGVALNKATTNIMVGGKETLVPAIAPVNATNKIVTWTSSNIAVATVSNAGEVTGVAVGTANITVTTADGNRTAVCSVTVVAAPIAVSSVSINKYATTIPVGSSETLVATVLPVNATNKTIYWHSTNQSVAGVATLTGQVFGISTGVATITVTTVDGSKTAFCGVTVTAASGTAEPAAEDKAAIQAIIDARLALDVKKYSGLSISTEEVDAVHATLSPIFLEYGMNAADWRTEALTPVASGEADVASFSGTGWEFKQISPDTWLVARLGNINLKDGSSSPMAGLSSFWQYSADLRVLTATGLMKPEPESHAIQLVKKEGGVWKILGDQCKVDWANIRVQFTKYEGDGSVTTEIYPFMKEYPAFAVATATVTGSFITQPKIMQKGADNWYCFDGQNYSGIAPSNAGAIISMVVQFTDGSSQTLEFTQPAFTGMAPLQATINGDGLSMNWTALADATKFSRVYVQYNDFVTGAMISNQWFSEDSSLTATSFNKAELGLASGQKVWVHVTINQTNNLDRHYFALRTIP